MIWKGFFFFHLPNQAALDANFEIFRAEMEEAGRTVSSWPMDPRMSKRFEMTIVPPNETPADRPPWRSFLGDVSDDIKGWFTLHPNATKCALLLNPDDFDEDSFSGSIYLSFGMEGERPFIVVVLPVSEEEKRAAGYLTRNHDYQPLAITFNFTREYSFLYFVKKLVQWALGKRRPRSDSTRSI